MNYMHISLRPPLDRLVARSVERKCPVKGLDLPCWVVRPQYRSPQGYGHVSINGRSTPAHRAAYVELIGPIPTRLDLDHLCRNRPCWNPWHMDPVTRSVNILRGFAALKNSS